MHKPLLTVLLLICALGTFGCATTGRDVPRPAVCPVTPSPPASLMKPPEYGQRVRRELLQPPTKPTPKCADCNGTHER